MGRRKEAGDMRIIKRGGIPGGTGCDGKVMKRKHIYRMVDTFERLIAGL